MTSVLATMKDRGVRDGLYALKQPFDSRGGSLRGREE